MKRRKMNAFALFLTGNKGSASDRSVPISKLISEKCMKTLMVMLWATCLCVLTVASGWNNAQAQYVLSDKPEEFAQQKTLYVQIAGQPVRDVRIAMANAKYVVMANLHPSGKFGFMLKSGEPAQIALARQEILDKFPNAVIEVVAKKELDAIFTKLINNKN